MASRDPESKTGKVIFDIDAEAEGDTFVTGLGIPGKTKRGTVPHHEDESKFYGSLEDELMDRVDQTE